MISILIGVMNGSGHSSPDAHRAGGRLSPGRGSKGARCNVSEHAGK
jgi:hypothetical protein